jgi:hypothetical protein
MQQDERVNEIHRDWDTLFKRCVAVRRVRVACKSRRVRARVRAGVYEQACKSRRVRAGV